jgi:hypothetical protein
MSQREMPLTALEVLTTGRSPGAMPGGMWGKPLAQASVPLKAHEPNVTCADVATKLDQKTAKPPLDNNELDKSAASVLLGLQIESVIAHTTPYGSFYLGVLCLTCFVVQARMSHKQVEQHRRQKAKVYFDELRCLVPTGRDPKNDRNRVLQVPLIDRL